MKTYRYAQGLNELKANKVRAYKLAESEGLFLLVQPSLAVANAAHGLSMPASARRSAT